MRHNTSENLFVFGSNIKQSHKVIANLVIVLIFTLALHIPSESKAQENHPANYDTLLQEAIQLRNAGDFTAAEQILLSARKLASHTNEVDYLLGLVVAYQERFAEALVILDGGLKRYSEDTQLQLAKARVLSFTENHLAALALIDAILATQPDNLEAIVLAARVNFYLQEYTRSSELFDQVLSRHPGNLEALLGQYDVNLATGNAETAQVLLDQAESIDPAAPEVILRRERSLAALMPTEKRHELNSGYTISNVDGADLANWYDRYLEYRYRSDKGNQFFVRNEHLHRFGSHDTLMEVGTVVNWGADRSLEFAVAYGDDSDFSPEQRFRLATSVKIFDDRDGFGTSLLDLAYSQAEYQTGDVETGRVGVTHYFSSFNGWANAGALWVNDENSRSSVGWTSGINWQTSNKVRIGYGFTDAPDTENNITTDTETHHLYASYQLTDRFALRLDGSRNERKNSYSRDSLSLSLQFRF